MGQLHTDHDGVHPLDFCGTMRVITSAYPIFWGEGRTLSATSPPVSLPVFGSINYVNMSNVALDRFNEKIVVLSAQDSI